MIQGASYAHSYKFDDPEGNALIMLEGPVINLIRTGAQGLIANGTKVVGEKVAERGLQVGAEAAVDTFASQGANVAKGLTGHATTWVERNIGKLGVGAAGTAFATQYFADSAVKVTNTGIEKATDLAKTGIGKAGELAHKVYDDTVQFVTKPFKGKKGDESAETNSEPNETSSASEADSTYDEGYVTPARDDDYGSGVKDDTYASTAA